MMSLSAFMLMAYLSLRAIAQPSPSDPQSATPVLGADPVDDAAKGDRERLQGTWSVTKFAINGKPTKDRGLTRSTWTFRGDELVVDGGEGKERHTYKLDAASDPRAIFTNRVEPKRPQSG